MRTRFGAVAAAPAALRHRTTPRPQAAGLRIQDTYKPESRKCFDGISSCSVRACIDLHRDDGFQASRHTPAYGLLRARTKPEARESRGRIGRVRGELLGARAIPPKPSRRATQSESRSKPGCKAGARPRTLCTRAAAGVNAPAPAPRQLELH